ncbi:ribbon-helix-helix domain-containing protein [Hellea balneolensis]|uniref:ribbon-helix-helix domain-containing protein n=1 Tax=Hellea balneolensis TaxID=287478 RepID=UPI000400343C|nr:CopG family transcriptional regulator [Hellea balneolensis]
MKKTEKIEVRLSHEEKTALTNLAEQEGRSVSDLVRGLIERYMSINTTRLPRKMPWLLLMAIGIAGFFVGHIATYLIAKSHHHTPIYDMRVELGGDGISFPLLAKPGQGSVFTIPAKSGDILIKPNIESVPENLTSVTVSLCRQSGTSCEFIAAPKLQFNPNRQSAISFKEDSGQEVYIYLHKTRQPGK